MVPGTEQVILGLINNELCADLVNLASNTSNMVPPPTPVTGTYPSGGGYSTFNYALSVGNQSGTPACGTVTIQTPAGNQATIAGQPVDMAAIQQAALNDVLTKARFKSKENCWISSTCAGLAGVSRPLAAKYGRPSRHTRNARPASVIIPELPIPVPSAAPGFASATQLPRTNMLYAGDSAANWIPQPARRAAVSGVTSYSGRGPHR